MLVKLQSAVSLLTCGCLVSLAASPSSIGFVVTNGQAQVDGALVQRNSTLFQGSLVQSGEVSSDLMVAGGSNLLLQPGSSANVYRDYAVLRSGTATARGGHGYVLVADGLKVSSLSAAGAVVVGLKDRSRLEVSAQGGTAEVRNTAGALVARLEPGKALSFALQTPAPSTPQESPAVPTAPAVAAAPAAPALPQPGQQLTLHGIVRKDHAGRYGHFLLTDLSSQMTYELQGPGLDDLVGGSVEAIGTILATEPVPGAARVLSIFDIHQMTMSEMTGNPEPAEANATAEAPAATPSTPSGDVSATPGAGTETGAQPAATAPAESASASVPPPVAVHSDTAKILLIVALAAGGGVGVALGLAGGKSSTVSPE
jgi:hypothetical protein